MLFNYSFTVSTKYAFNISATFCRFLTMPASFFNSIFLSDEEHFQTCLFITCHIFCFVCCLFDIPIIISFFGFLWYLFVCDMVFLYKPMFLLKD